MTPEELKREDEFLEAQAKAIREHITQKKWVLERWRKEYEEKSESILGLQLDA